MEDRVKRIWSDENAMSVVNMNVPRYLYLGREYNKRKSPFITFTSILIQHYGRISIDNTISRPLPA